MQSHRASSRCSDRAKALLADLVRSVGAVDADDVAIVVAHPRDETISCGAQLSRLRNATLIIVTDGAPRHLFDARMRGFDTAEAYATHRSAELARALEIAGNSTLRGKHLGVPDQEAAYELVRTARDITHVRSSTGDFSLWDGRTHHLRREED